MGVQISEYIVKLGTEIDNSGFQQILSLLSSTKLKALGITAAISAASTAIYKYVEASTKQEFELRKLQKTKQKSIEQLRAEQTALKIMGMTLKDIEKDRSLNKVYKDLVAFNKELEMPNMDKALTNVRSLQNAFWKAKSVINYAVQAIGDKVLINLEAPIKRITGHLDNITDWFKKNYQVITSRTAVFITDFAKGVLGIFEGVRGIGKLVDKLPDSVKSVGTAFLAVWGIVKSGPLGQILLLITAIGDVMHDIDNYKANIEKGLKPGEEGYVQNLNDTLGIWDFIFGTGSPEEKAKTMTGAILTGINAALTDFSSQLDSAKIGSWFDEESGWIGQIFGGIKEYLTSDEGSTQLSNLLNNIIDTALSFEGFIGRTGVDVAKKLGLLVGKAFKSTNFETGVEEAFGDDNTAASGVVTGVITAILTKGNIFASLAVGLSTVYKNALLKAGKKLDDETDAEYMMRVMNIGIDDFGEFATGIFNMVSGALATVNDTSGTLLSSIIQAIIKAIGGADEDTLSGAMAKAVAGMGETDLFGALGTTLGTTIATGGNFGIGIITGMFSYFSDLAQKVDENHDIWDVLKEDAKEFWTYVEDIWYGPLEEQADGKMARNDRKGLGSIFKKLWEGDEDFMGLSTVFQKIGEKIGAWMAPVGDAIKTFFSNLWVEIFNNLPGWMKTIFGLKNPNTSTVSQDEESGEVTISSTTGAKKTYAKGGISSNAQAILNKYGEFFTIDDDGKVTMTNGSEEMVVKGYGKQRGAGEKAIPLQGVLQYIINNGILPGEGGREAVRFGGDSYLDADSFEQLFNNTSLKGKPIAEILPKVDTSTIQSQIDSGNYHVNADVQISGGDEKGSKKENAWGGRFGSRHDNMTVGEDGAEYIIPITKPDRAFDLIYQMLNEMGSSAINRLAEGLGIGEPGTAGYSKAAMEGTMAGMQMANTYNVTAPVTIYVNSNGSDAKEIGNNVYDAAERHLIKNIGEVLA